MTAAELTQAKRDRLEVLKLKYRVTVCRGCRHNRYNFRSAGTDTDAPTTGEGCWYLAEIRKANCRMFCR